MDKIKYVHTNLIASDWNALSNFYINVFGCKPLYPERDLSGGWLDRLTNIDGVKIRGIHLSLPGYENGPTLEIFEYKPEAGNIEDKKINGKGLGHIAFDVSSVEEILDKLIEFGGTPLGEVVKREYEGLGMLTVVYAKDPEGNYIEIQNWSK
jgi:predicted enzyme related to lactoylglutathione lyase